MFFKKILVPYDGSKNANRAFEKALDMAKNTNTKIKIITCIFRGHGTDMAYETRFVDLFDVELEKEALSKINKLGTLAKKSGVHVDGAVVKTLDAAQKIADFAKKEKSDLIILGSHGRSGFAKMVLGSVSNGVLSKASCPVMIVQ